MEIFIHLEPHIVNSHASTSLRDTNNALTLVPVRVSEDEHFEVTGKLFLTKQHSDSVALTMATSV